MKSSAAEGRTPMLFSALDALASCLFCGDRTEGRYMCSKCRPLGLVEIFWIGRQQ